MSERRFNTAGPGQPDVSYVLDPLKRINLNEIEKLIEQRKYFVMHAPRQSGKTSCLLALRNYLNAQGEYYCVYANVEAGQAYRNDVRSVLKAIIGTVGTEARMTLKKPEIKELAREMQRYDEPDILFQFLTELSCMLDKPMVLLIDEIDALVGDSLVSVLRQIRAGYANRPQMFPQSIVLCGVRDVRDYRIHTGGQEVITGGSAFNIKAASLRLGNFTREEIRELYRMHTDETGQRFDEGCFDVVWTATEGQPWLVNALANEATYEMAENRDRTVTIIPEMIYRAQERIIYRRDTHIDALLDKLQEERVRRVIGPILAKSEKADEWLMPSEDLMYVVGLGLVAMDNHTHISNAIYREIIRRAITNL